MSLWLLNIYIDGVMREMKAVCGHGIEMCGNVSKWVVNAILFC